MIGVLPYGEFEQFGDTIIAHCLWRARSDQVLHIIQNRHDSPRPHGLGRA